uniref:Wsv131-like protein n=1 Tax=Sesarmops intermedium nimavirus TaxID=2133796 RepID=A0A401IPV0_9VIRU|nr:wsv131-like protein [Sesarmops intermedium nimavirus]
MDYLSLLAEGYGNNKEAATELFKNSVPAFTRDEKNIVNEVLKDITNGVTGKDDYLTTENVIADPTTKRRITSFLTMNAVLQSCEIKHPTVNSTTLSDIQNAMAIPTSDIVVLSPEHVTNNIVVTADSAMRSQMRFGFDAVTEILKNCCASHTVIHSILKSALMTLYEKVKEWGPQQLETPGQEMALCTILQSLGKIREIVKEAKKSTTRKIVKSNSSCGRCKAKGHGSSTIITPFINRVNAKYDDSTSSAMRAIDSQNYNLPPEFLVRGGKKPRNPMADDLGGCSFTSSSNISSMTENWATGRVKERAKRARLDTSMRFIMDQFNKDKPAVVTKDTRPLISPLSPETSQEEKEITPPKSTPAGPMDGVLTPTADLESTMMESRGQMPGAQFIKSRDVANNKSINRYASRGSGINMGPYRTRLTL